VHLSDSISHFLGWVFHHRVLGAICPWLALNRDPPDLCLLSSWDYRREPPVSGALGVFLKNIFIST
jgi:hypothetical protein